MKKLMLFAAAAVFSLSSVNAQDVSFGALAGLSISSAKVDSGGFSATESETGFHIGAFADIPLSDTFGVQPELTYTISGDVSLINVNAIAKYNVSEEFNIQLGPQIGFVGGDFGDFLDDADDTTKLNLQLAAGAGYNINENIFVQARYGFQLNNHYTGDADLDINVNSLTVGVGYRF
ncbi:MAG: porin family protein [Algicola sp.]|nr:porin family protein [Algicola sp.]